MTDILPDSLTCGLVLVFCGTAASKVSAEKRAYYANPGNSFWRTLYQAGFTPRLYAPREFPKLLDLRIGLTDLAKATAGVDAELKRSDFQPKALDEKMLRVQPQVLAFTSKAAWRAWRNHAPKRKVAWGWQQERLGATRVYVLPSPSGAARRSWDLEPWLRLAEDYRARCAAINSVCQSEERD